MKCMGLAGLVAIFCLSVSGCAGMYTNIDKASDGSYTVTKVTQGFWRVYGDLYRCSATGATMTCTKVGED